jgi:hypothetical protein
MRNSAWPALHVAAFLEQPLLHDAGRAGPHLGHARGLEPARQLGHQPHVAQRGGDHAHLGWRHAAAGRSAAGAAGRLGVVGLAAGGQQGGDREEEGKEQGRLVQGGHRRLGKEAKPGSLPIVRDPRACKAAGRIEPDNDRKLHATIRPSRAPRDRATVCWTSPPPMLEPAFPADDALRVDDLCRLQVLDTAPEGRFDRITRLASRTFSVPIALVSLVDTDRQWFKSRHGLGVEQTPRRVSFCAHAILNEGAFVIPDTLADRALRRQPAGDRRAVHPLLRRHALARRRGTGVSAPCA